MRPALGQRTRGTLDAGINYRVAFLQRSPVQPCIRVFFANRRASCEHGARALDLAPFLDEKPMLAANWIIYPPTLEFAAD